MHRSHSRHVVVTFVILLAVLACALPGQTIQPEPVTDPNAILTAVAGTAHAAEQQTQQANTVPATATAIPTDMMTSTPKISVSGTSLIVREDQSTLFTDYKSGIQLVVPAGWMAWRLHEEEYFKAFDSDIVLQNPVIFKHLTVIRDVNPDVFRLDAIDIHPEHMPNGVLTTFNVVFEEGDTRSLENWEKAERGQRQIFQDHKFISANYPQLDNGTRVLVIEESYRAAENKGTIYYRGVFFCLPSGTIVIDFHTHFDFKDEMLLEFDQVINSLTPIAP